MRHDEVTRLINEQRNLLEQEFGVQSLALFGSVTRDQASGESDIDLLVEFNRPVGFFGLLALQDFLEKLFGCPVDLGTPGGLKPRIKSQILAEQVRVL